MASAIMDAGVWKQPITSSVMDSGSWKNINNAFVMDGTWKAFYGSAPPAFDCGEVTNCSFDTDLTGWDTAQDASASWDSCSGDGCLRLDDVADQSFGTVYGTINNLKPSTNYRLEIKYNSVENTTDNKLTFNISRTYGGNQNDLVINIPSSLGLHSYTVNPNKYKGIMVDCDNNVSDIYIDYVRLYDASLSSQCGLLSNCDFTTNLSSWLYYGVVWDSCSGNGCAYFDGETSYNRLDQSFSTEDTQDYNLDVYVNASSDTAKTIKTTLLADTQEITYNENPSVAGIVQHDFTTNATLFDTTELSIQRNDISKDHLEYIGNIDYIRVIEL